MRILRCPARAAMQRSSSNDELIVHIRFMQTLDNDKRKQGTIERVTDDQNFLSLFLIELSCKFLHQYVARYIVKWISGIPR